MWRVLREPSKLKLIILFLLLSGALFAQDTLPALSCQERIIPEIKTSSLIAPYTPYIGHYAPQIGVDFIVDYKLFQLFDSSISKATTYIDSIATNMTLVYHLDTMQVCATSLKIYDHPDSLYSSLDSLTFGQARQTLVQTGDVFCLLTPANVYGGGVSWVGGLKANPYNCCMCGLSANVLWYPAYKYASYPNWCWDNEVVDHELGHCLGGSPHTHGCAWNGNNTKIDDCGGSVGYGEGNCPPEPDNDGCPVTDTITYSPAKNLSCTDPAGGGTIMSYCHLTGVGINMSKRFGIQVSDSMRSYQNYYTKYLSNAPCMEFNTPLPVELLIFEGATTPVSNILHWQTESEINVNYFTLYKNDTAIASMKGHGTSDVLNDYKFIDQDVIKVTNYYTLKETDFNGVTYNLGTIVLIDKVKMLENIALGDYDIIGRRIKR